MTDIAAIAAGLSAYGPDHPDYPNAPSDWDGGPMQADDGKLYWIPPEWSWKRVALYQRAHLAALSKEQGGG